MDEVSVGNWEEAVTLARSLDHETAVRISKADEPVLPSWLDLRLSNFPWSIHKGATAVYRETERGDHLQIREYPDSWTVSLDRYNPRYRPVGHATVDIPVHMVVAMGALTPIRGYRWVVGDSLPSPGSAVAFSTKALGAVPRFGRSLLGSVESV